MKTFFLLLSLSFLLTAVKAQKKELQLGESVSGQWRQFYPQRWSNLQWVPTEERFTFLNEDRTALMVQGVKDKKARKLFTLKKLNKSLALTLKSFPSIRWESKENFTFQQKGITYFVAYKANKLSLTTKVIFSKEGAANLDFHKKTKQIAYTKANNLYWQDAKGLEYEIFVSDDKNIVTGQAIARYEFGIGKGIFWSPEGAKLAFYQKDETAVSDYPLVDITAVPAKVNLIKYPMAGQASEQAKVGVYDVASQKTIFLKIEGDKEQYLTNLGWGPAGKYIYLAVVNRDQNHVWLNKYDAQTGDLVQTLFEEKNDRYVEPDNPVWFLPNNKNEFIWFSERDGFKHLYRYDTNGKLLQQVTKGKWAVMSILGLDAKGKNVLLSGTDESGLNTTVYTAALAKSPKVSRLISQEGIHRVKLSSNKKYMLDGYSNLKTPYQLRLLKTKGKQKTVLFTAPNPYDSIQIATTELLKLKANDGTFLNARLIKPANFDANKKYPVIVYVYGGPQAQLVTNSWLGGASLWMHYAANQGYLVFTLDNRGSANRGFEFESCIHRQLSKLEMEDQMTGVEYLKTLPYANTDKMAVHGWSYGGFMTTSMMLKYPDVFKVGVAGGPVTNWAFYEIMYGERYMDRPQENKEGYEATSLVNYADQLKGDLLLIHGTADDVVVMQHNLTLIQAFVEKGIPVDFFAYPMHKHNVRGKDRIHLIRKVLTYIDEKLK